MGESAHYRVRSWLFTPATRPERFLKATEVGADALIIDLEDAVSPKDKASARDTAIEYLAGAGAAPHRTANSLRINSIQTRFGLDDVVALLASKADPAFIVLPKAEAAQDLVLLDRWLAAAGKKARLIALIESAKALTSLEALAVATPRLLGFMFGAADMAADLSAAVNWDALLGARQRIVAAAALSHIVAIDTPFFDIHDVDGLKADIARSNGVGFTAKAAIHPAQVGPINDALTPSKEAVEHAKKVIEENYKGVGKVDGQMIDEAVARQARRTLTAAGINIQA